MAAPHPSQQLQLGEPLDRRTAVDGHGHHPVALREEHLLERSPDQRRPGRDRGLDQHRVPWAELLVGQLEIRADLDPPQVLHPEDVGPLSLDDQPVLEAEDVARVRRQRGAVPDQAEHPQPEPLGDLPEFLAVIRRVLGEDGFGEVVAEGEALGIERIGAGGQQLRPEQDHQRDADHRQRDADGRQLGDPDRLHPEVGDHLAGHQVGRRAEQQHRSPQHRGVGQGKQHLALGDLGAVGGADRHREERRGGDRVGDDRGEPCDQHHHRHHERLVTEAGEERQSLPDELHHPGGGQPLGHREQGEDEDHRVVRVPGEGLIRGEHARKHQQRHDGERADLDRDRFDGEQDQRDDHDAEHHHRRHVRRPLPCSRSRDSRAKVVTAGRARKRFRGIAPLPSSSAQRNLPVRQTWAEVRRFHLDAVRQSALMARISDLTQVTENTVSVDDRGTYWWRISRPVLA
jgi:hypothetical protein